MNAVIIKVDHHQDRLSNLPLLIFMAIVIWALVFGSSSDPDSSQYIAIAEGHIDSVIKPFSSRFLLPLSAYTIHKYIPAISLPTAFYLLQLFLCTVLGLALLSLQIALRLNPFWLALSLCTPLFAMTISEIYLPDLGAMSIVALSLALLARGYIAAALVILIPGLLIRESLALFGFILIGSLGYQRKLRLAAFGMLCLIIGLAISGWVTRDGPGNVHELNPALYFLLKLPVNFISNFMGVSIWVDSFDWCTTPFVQFALPSTIPAGNIHSIGLCWADTTQTLRNWTLYGVAFGVLPGALIAFWKQARRQRNIWPLAVVIALIYGALMTVIGPMSGKTITRLIYYGWPAFTIALPALNTLTQRRFDISIMAGIAGLHMTLLLLSTIEVKYPIAAFPEAGPIAMGCAAILANLQTYRLVSRR